MNDIIPPAYWRKHSYGPDHLMRGKDHLVIPINFMLYYMEWNVNFMYYETFTLLGFQVVT